jgi:hypothetical protein
LGEVASVDQKTEEWGGDRSWEWRSGGGWVRVQTVEGVELEGLGEIEFGGSLSKALSAGGDRGASVFRGVISALIK